MSGGVCPVRADVNGAVVWGQMSGEHMSGGGQMSDLLRHI